MDDRADVGLVDAHAKRIGGDDDRHRAGHEGVLGLGPVLRALTAMVGRRRDAFRPEQRVQCVDVAHRGRVDDGRSGRAAHDVDELALFVGVAGDRADVVRQVRTMGSGVDHAERTDSQLPFDVGNHVGRRGCRERQDRRRSECAQPRERVEIRRSEIMSPLTDAVGFIDDDEIDRITS